MNYRKPKIRFPEFNDDWEQRKLGELSSSFEYGLNAAAKEYDGENKYIRITDIDDESHAFKQDDLTSPDTDLSVADNYKLSEGDILFARTGASVGKSYIYKVSDGLVYYAGFLIRARIKEENNPEFVYQNTLTNNYEKFIQVTSMRSGQPGVNAQEYSQFEIMIPSKAEQDKIAYCFRNLDNLITLHQRKCDHLKELKKGLLQKMFPKTGSSVPEIRFPGFTDAWEQRKLGELSSSFEYGLNAAAKEYDGENKYIRITDIDDESHEFKQDDLTSPDTDLSVADNYKLSEGDILFARTGASVGKSYIYKASDGLVYYAGFLIRARIKEENNPEFVYQNTLTNNYEKFIQVTSMRSGQPGVNAQEYSQFEIMIPSKAEQDKIAYCFRNLDNLITLHQRKCDELKEVKKYMLQNMFPN
ncbi:restriction endonuclease subunit S [Pseudobutyrivibrio sp. LB2011]|uniref:restriction endonuclease subunit S n=1 Tax=Pseudobutyrivibrio sp. LB2011 TaxID=1408312 RepID=UPI0005D257FA|nr:restriction endonuclease subunit S [Pseudobutyrivibrio sp. LB2011]